MSRILKRPMFRRGGEVMEGVMTGIRNNYAFGTQSPYKETMNPEMGGGKNRGLMAFTEENNSPEPNINNYDISKLSPSKSNFEKSMNMADYIMGRYGSKKGIGSDAVAQALIQGGLRAIGGAGAGKGVLGELATAFEPVVGEAFKQKQKERDTKMGLAVELYKGMSKDDRLAFEKKAEQYAKLKGISKEEAMLQFLEKDLSEASPYLKGPSPQAEMAKIKADMIKDKFAYGVSGLNDLELTRVAKVASEAESKIFRGEDPGFQVGIYPSKEELEQIDENTIKYNPTVEPRGKIKSKFTSGGVYYLPAIDTFGVYDGNTKTFKIK